MQIIKISYFMMYLIYLACNNKVKSDFEANIEYYNEISNNIPILCKENGINIDSVYSYKYFVVINADICTCQYYDIDNILLKLKKVDYPTILIAIDKNDFLLGIIQNFKHNQCKVYFNKSNNISRLGFDFPHQVIYNCEQGKFTINEIF